LTRSPIQETQSAVTTFALTPASTTQPTYAHGAYAGSRNPVNAAAKSKMH
jgi:hypothetical protein